MKWQGAGRKALRWGVWILLGWVLLRGLISFLPGRGSEEALASAPELAQEPDGLRSFPALFAWEYLTWQSDDPEERAERLKPYLHRSLDRQAGWIAGSDRGSQRAEAAWVYGVRELGADRYLVTVTARVASQAEIREAGGLQRQQGSRTLWLAVPIIRTAEGRWLVYDYPSLLPAPARGETVLAAEVGTAVEDPGGGVRMLLQSFFRAYFGGDVTYFMAPGAEIPTLTDPWLFVELGKLSQYETAAGRRVLAEVVVRDTLTAARYKLRYTLYLNERDGRWYVRDIEQKGD